MDYGHRESDRRLAELERRIDREYRQAYTEIKAKADEFFEKFRDKDKKLSQKVKQGEINKSDYIEWRRKAMIRGNALINLEKTLAQDLVNADRIAGQMISGHKVDVYALNRNYGEYEIENALNIDLGFSIYDHKSVEKLIKEQPALLPTQLDEARDLKWNRQKVSSAITQGILQGESIPNIGKRLRKVVGMDKTASIRNARTATTGAENAGRVDSYVEAESKGVELEKKWVATLDQRTRSEHRQLDGQTCPIHDKFEVDGEEIAYPGDPTAAGYLVYNCRCTLVAEVKGIEYKDVRWDKLGDMSYEEWKGKKEKAQKQTEPIAQKFTPAKDISEAQQRARNLGAIYTQFDKWDIERANNALEALETLPADCRPKAILDGKGTSIITDRPIGRKAESWYGVSYDYRPFSLRTMQLGFDKTDFDGGQVVGLNVKGFKTLDKLTAIKEKRNKEYREKTGRNWSFNTEGKATAYHEMGHCFYNVRLSGNARENKWESIANRWASESDYDMIQKPEEAFAEAWAGYHLKDNRLPQYVKDFIKEML